MGMVEKVAIAIYKKRNGVLCRPWSILTTHDKTPYMDDARAAIAAMREPTEEMVDAGVEAKMKLYEKLEESWINTRIVVVANHPAGTIYQAMIDKALESGE